MLLNQKFAEYLISNGYYDETIVNKFLVQAEDVGTPIYYEFVKDKSIDEVFLFKALAKFLNYEFKSLQIVELNMELLEKFPREKLIEFRAIPYKEDDEFIYFLSSDPLKEEDIAELQGFTSKKFKVVLATHANVKALVDYFDNRVQQKSVMNDFDDSIFKTEQDDSKSVQIDAPIITLCDSILKDAASRKASDIHIEPYEDELLLRYRIDGKLLVIDHIKMSLYQAILARYKIMAEMNIAERRIPQDGKISMNINGIDYDFRVSTLPTIHGEKIVIRIFNVTFSRSSIESLGLKDDEKEIILSLITRPHGIILLTGPTGSGKSTSLYTFLRYLNRDQVNIITVEDPVENQIKGISQVQVNPKANMTFASALRSILRQDPNIIMIGEIRDEETAQIATRAAITGHLVFSTLHTNSATGVVSRLVNMGVPQYLIADSLLGVISQRLVRKLCPVCKEKHTTTKSEMKFLGLSEPAEIYQAHGCSSCNHTGYAGRCGIFEIMVVDEKVRSTIMDEHFSTELLNKVTDRKMVSLIDNCKEKVLKGETSFQEFSDLLEVVSKEF